MTPSSTPLDLNALAERIALALPATTLGIYASARDDLDAVRAEYRRIDALKPGMDWDLKIHESRKAWLVKLLKEAMGS